MPLTPATYTTTVVGHILIVEDEPMIARILDHKLTREGHTISWVKTAEKMVAAIAKGDVDLALVDVTLEVDGIDAAAAMAIHPTAGWVALTEVRRESDRARALAAGATSVVTKPFKPTQVAAEVARLLAAHSAPAQDSPSETR